MNFCIDNGEMDQYMHKMMPKHVIALEIGSIAVGLSRLLGTTADSPLEYLYD